MVVVIVSESPFAGAPQASNSPFWRLRESRKHQILRFGICGSPASIKFSVLAFAGVPQVSNSSFWRLRESRKYQILRFGVCGSPASIKFSVLAFAGVPQASNSPFWRLRESRKHQILRFGVCGSPASTNGLGFGVCSVSVGCLTLAHAEAELAFRAHAVDVE